MPGKDGTGPVGTGIGKGRMGGFASPGPGGFCECPQCGTKIQHKRAEPCTMLECPQCRSKMVRK